MRIALLCLGLLVAGIGCGAGMNGSAPPKAEAAAAEAGGDAVAADVPESERRLIYEGSLSLVVDDIDTFDESIAQAVAELEGFVSENDGRQHQRYRSSRWVVRVPAQRFDDAMKSFGELGNVEHRSRTAEDVTAQYMDLEARIKAKRELEARVFKLLQEREAALKDVLEVERELSRVRGEIESMEAQFRYLRSRVSYSTITLNAREEDDYVPISGRTFGERIAAVWGQSLKSIKLAGQWVVFAVVGIVPWIIPALLAFFLWRRIRSHRASS